MGKYYYFFLLLYISLPLYILYNKLYIKSSYMRRPSLIIWRVSEFRCLISRFWTLYTKIFFFSNRRLYRRSTLPLPHSHILLLLLKSSKEAGERKYRPGTARFTLSINQSHIPWNAVGACFSGIERFTLGWHFWLKKFQN